MPIGSVPNKETLQMSNIRRFFENADPNVVLGLPLVLAFGAWGGYNLVIRTIQWYGH
ncbi:MAG TPA: hypothetical protein VLK22_04630 [Candidatus Udaeobacter sp.]|nr:hypothetical protein [Candidatus Udaeobacter sp.]